MLIDPCERAVLERGRPTAWAHELLALYESACQAPVEAFERAAVAQLGRLVGFDGAVWGRGAPKPGGRGVRIDTATVLDRDERLLHDYAHADEADPVAQAFFAQPPGVQCIDVGAFYREPGRQRIGDCLRAHDVGQLMLGGRHDASVAGGATAPRSSWITAYRREARRPFEADDADRFASLLPHWVQAREVCAELSQARGRKTASATVSPPRAATVTALSPRESEVLVLVSRGFSHGETAALMGLSRATVQSHVRNLYGKLGVHTKTEAVFEARALGWLD